MAHPIHQVTPTLAAGDAVGNLVRLIRDRLQKAGQPSEIFADRTDERSRGEASPVDRLLAAPRGATVVVHHSIQSRLIPLLRRISRRARIVVAYHNVTPPELVAGFDPPLARSCAEGRAELEELAA